jgi:hypothetical protein
MLISIVVVDEADRLPEEHGPSDVDDTPTGGRAQVLWNIAVGSPRQQTRDASSRPA